MRLFWIVLLLTPLLFLACNKKFTADKLPAKQLIFGTGGGIAGIEKRFILLENGQLFMQKSAEKPIALTKLSRKENKKLWEQVGKLNLVDAAVNGPGNMYQFMEIGPDEKRQRFVWGKANTAAPQEMINCYEALMRAVASQPGI